MTRVPTLKELRAQRAALFSEPLPDPREGAQEILAAWLDDEGAARAVLAQLDEAGLTFCWRVP